MSHETVCLSTLRDSLSLKTNYVDSVLLKSAVDRDCKAITMPEVLTLKTIDAVRQSKSKGLPPQ